MNKYTPIIGLEVHVELKTKSKMFCSCSTDYFGKQPNTHTCPICLGLPGALPVPNQTAIEWCIKIAQALNSKINKFSKFDRKNYFYPDLAKGYQISQYDLPFGEKGSMKLSTGKIIGITRVHMEEDTGKLSHNTINDENLSLIDFNRSGIPLVEIVTEPDFNTASEVKEYLQRLQQIVRYLDVSNADMEKGDMRLEPNISLLATEEFVFPIPKEKLPRYKVEVKNINSFRFVEKAISFEIERQKAILDRNEIPLQETRGWNESKGQTISQRIKEEANDYRYFPDPDLPPITFTTEQIITLKDSLPELPEEKAKRFISEYNLTPYDTEIITRDKMLANFFEKTLLIGKEKNITPKQIVNIIINKKINPTKTSAENIIEQIQKSSHTEIIDEEELEKTIRKVLQENKKAVDDYKSGKESVIMFLLGQTMRLLQKKVDANLVKQKLLENID